jgi:RNA polymerase sigma-70 factor (ECF subfamily)
LTNDFHTTRWTVVLAAGDKEAPDAQHALATLCETYWYPIYAYARRKGHAAPEAEDLTQGFFSALLEKDYVNAADPERGRFRAFLLTAFQRYVSRERDRARAQKRGGGRAPLSLDFAYGERRYTIEPSHELTPERAFDRRWAITLLETVVERLQREMADAGKSEVFDGLKPHLLAPADGAAYADLAERLDSTEGAVKTALHRLRSRYRDLLRDEIAETVSGPGEVDSEIGHLLQSLHT